MLEDPGNLTNRVSVPSNKPRELQQDQHRTAIITAGSLLSIAASDQNTATPHSSTSALGSSKIGSAASIDAIRRLEQKWSMSGGIGTGVNSRTTEDAAIYPWNARVSSPWQVPRNTTAIYASSSPVRRRAAVSPGIFSTYVQKTSSDVTLLEELDVQPDISVVRNMNLLSLKDPMSQWGAMFLLDASAVIFVSIIFTAIWYDVLVGRGPVMGLITAELLAFSLLVGLGIFNSNHVSDYYRPHLSWKISVPIALAIVLITLYYWVISFVSFTFLVALVMLPLYGFPMAKGFASLDQVDLLYEISSMNDAALSSAISSVSFQGFYLPENVNSTFLGNSLQFIFRYLQSGGGNLFVEVDSSLQQISDLSTPLCSFETAVSIIFVAKSFQTLKNLRTIGIPTSATAFSNPIGHQSSFESSLNGMNRSFSVEVVPTEMVCVHEKFHIIIIKNENNPDSKLLLNPWLTDAARRRNHQIISKAWSSPNLESYGIFFTLILAGASAIVTSGNIANIANLPSLHSIGTTIISNAGIFSNSSIAGSTSITWSEVPFSIKWGAACGIPTFLAIILGLASFVNESLDTKRKLELTEERKKIEQEARWKQQRQNNAEIALYSSSTIAASFGTTFNFGARMSPCSTEFEEAVSKYTAKKQKAINVRKEGSRIAEYVAIIGWFLFALGIGLSGDNCVPNSEVLMYIFGVTGFSSSIISFSMFETSATPFTIILSVFLNDLSVLGGWIMTAIGMGRFYVDIGSFKGETANHGMGPIGSIISTAITCFISIFCSWVNSTSLIALATGLTMLSLMLVGGLLGEIGVYCLRQDASCPNQLLAMFAGGIFMAVGLGLSLMIRFWSFESQETKLQKLLLLCQSNFNDKLKKKKSKVAIQNTETVTEEPVKLPLRPYLFVHISNFKTTFKLWNLALILALTGWLLFLGGFGASSGYSGEAIGAGIIFTVSSPIALASTSLAMIRDSREIAAFSQTVLSISYISFGGVIHSSSAILASNDTIQYSDAISFVISGSLTYFIATVGLFGSLICKFKHQYKQGYLEARYGGLLFSPPSVLSAFPNFVVQLSYVELGATIFKASAYFSSSVSGIWQTPVGPALMFVGASVAFLIFSAVHKNENEESEYSESSSRVSSNSEDSENNSQTKKNSKKKLIPLDIYGLILSWPLLQTSSTSELRF
ncbi:hypothetical protein HK100_010913 [Physocladia obscura]|uniref:Uncharacterized protein n=1 Tax=Physocladia obscura TaxID=109957 RepID=A0AAD5T2W8_9FUNG|nr:hypothetical protein HK100_010913 [Physocladia obscura]